MYLSWLAVLLRLLLFVAPLSLVHASSAGPELSIVVTYSDEQVGARDGVFQAIDEALNATNRPPSTAATRPIRARLVSVSSDTNSSDLCRLLFDGNVAPDLLVDTTLKDTQVSALVRSIGLPTVSSNPNVQRTWRGLTPSEAEYLVHFEPPTMLLVRTVLALIDQYSLNKYRVLYDESHAEAVLHLKQLLPEFVDFQSLEELATKDGLVRGTRRLWKFKMHAFVTLANVETINEFANAIDENDMFRAAYKWFFFTNDKRKVHCETCKHASFVVVKPRLCDLHEYHGTHIDDRKLLDKKVDLYFFYDLMRLALRPARRMSRGSDQRPDLTASRCEDVIKNEHASGHPIGSDGQRQQKQWSALALELREEAEDFHGKYGEFVVPHPPAPLSPELDTDSSGGSRGKETREVINCYQDISYEIGEISYLRNRRSRRKLGTWYYQEPNGVILFKSALEDDEEDKEADADADADADAEAEEEGAEKDGVVIFLVYHHPPFIFYHPEKNNGSFLFGKDATIDDIFIDGFMIDVMKEIRRRYPMKGYGEFPVHVIQQSAEMVLNNGWGYIEVKKTGAKQEGGGDAGSEEVAGPTGICKELKDSKGGWKMSLLPMTMTPERMDSWKIQFGEPYFETVSLSVLMRKPILQYHFFKFITVLEYSVWICITGAYFFTSVLLWIFDRTSPYSYQNNQEKFKDDDEKRLFTLKESLWFCITSLTPQGGGEAPKALSGRLVAATWWLFGFIIIASYTANLAAFLTVSRLDHKIDDLHDLSKQYKTKYAPFSGSSTKTYFERMARVEEKFYEVWKDLSLNDELEEDERAMLAVWDYPVADKYTKIWAQMSEAKFPATYEAALKRVKTVVGREGFALIAETTVVDYASRAHCDLMKVGGEFLPRPNSMAFAPLFKSDIKDKFDAIIKEMREDGTITKLKNKWWYETVPEKVCDEHRRMSNGISLRNVGGVFLVIAGGIVVTIVILYLENWHYDRQRVIDSRKARLQAIQGAVPKVKPKRRCAVL